MVKRRLLLGVVSAIIATAAGFGGTVTATHADSVGPCVPASPLTPTPTCPGELVFGANISVLGIGPEGGGCGAVCLNGATNATCTSKAFGHALTPGVGESAGSVTIPGFTLGPVTTQPATEEIPALNAPAQALAGGLGVCNATPPGPTGDVVPVITGLVCQQLWAQIATTNTNTVPPTVTTAWVEDGSENCNPLVGSAPVAAGQANQVYANLPGSGSGTWYNGSPNQIYTGLYDSETSAFGYEDGIALPSPGCLDNATSCDNYPFTV